MRGLLLASAAALALASGGSPAQRGEAERARPIAVSAQAPANLPGYLKVYPGARILKSMSNRRGGMVMMEANAPAETVMDFYRAAAAEAGLRTRLDSHKLGFGIHIGPHVVVFSAAGKGRFSASVEAKKGVTKVDLVYAAA